MFEITASDIFRFCRNSGGQEFTEFVNSIIRSELFVNKVGIDKLHTNLRINKPDKGVDTKLDIPIPQSSFGWLKEKTIWQYKATDQSRVKGNDLETEIKKSFVQECIKDGFHYRLCICDSISPDTKMNWEAMLNEEIKKITPNNITAMVISADDLAAWATCYPAISLKYKYPNGSGDLQTLNTWEQNVTKDVREYVEIPSYADIKRGIKQHIDFSAMPVEMCLSIFGAPGTGKTRFVYECLKDSAMRNLVVYCCDDSRIINILTILSNMPESPKAIIVADECPPERVYEIRTLFSGFNDRVRIIVIDNSNERQDGISQEYFMGRMPNEFVNKILEVNFFDIPIERLRKYAAMSEGFIRLTVDMCNHDDEIMEKGNLSPVFGTLEQYYMKRLDQEQRTAIEMLSLLTKTGYKGDVKSELEELCSFLSCEKENVLTIASILKEKTGFINFAGRYIYVTPDIIAKTAFEKAFKKWFENNFEDRMPEFPSNLISPFIQRVSGINNEYIRQKIINCFSQFVHSFDINDLKLQSSVFFFRNTKI